MSGLGGCHVEFWETALGFAPTRIGDHGLELKLR
jgi:hypothetical protein